MRFHSFSSFQSSHAIRFSWRARTSKRSVLFQSALAARSSQLGAFGSFRSFPRALAGMTPSQVLGLVSDGEAGVTPVPGVHPAIG